MSDTRIPIPEGCKLVAAHTGDGWSLEVHDGERCIAYLEWPKAWPSEVTTQYLEAIGFECT